MSNGRSIRISTGGLLREEWAFGQSRFVRQRGDGAARLQVPVDSIKLPPLLPEVGGEPERLAVVGDEPRIHEAGAIVGAVVMTVVVVRGCLRARRLTFDAKLCIAGLSTMWLDPFVNFYQPVFLYSSNWTNLNNWCNQVNPDCGRMPEPVIFVTFVYTFGLLLGL